MEKKDKVDSEKKDELKNTYRCYNCDYSWTVPKIERMKNITKAFCPFCSNQMLKDGLI